MKKTNDSGTVYRLKFGAKAVRYEKQISHSTKYSNNKEWIRLRSGYYSKLRVEDGKLVGMTR